MHCSKVKRVQYQAGCYADSLQYIMKNESNKEACSNNTYTNISNDSLRVDALLDNKRTCSRGLLDDDRVFSRNRIPDEILCEALRLLLNADCYFCFSQLQFSVALKNNQTVK